MSRKEKLFAGGLLLAGAACSLWLAFGTASNAERAPQVDPHDVKRSPVGETDPVAKGVEWFKNAELTPKKLRSQMRGLARRGDETSFLILKELSESSDFNNIFPLEAMGCIENPRLIPLATEQLKKHFDGENVERSGVALFAYGKLLKEKAAAELQARLVANRRRPDGRGEEFCAAIIKAMEFCADDCEAALIAELSHVGEPDWLPDYGSLIVTALAKRKTPEAQAALLAYADALTLKMPPQSNPPGRQYMREKITEARDAAHGAAEEPAIPTPE
jgi:hypothetical protein